MEFLILWKVIQRWWWIILIPLVITTVASLPAIPDAVSPPETYGTTIRFTAAAPPDQVNALAAEVDDARSGSYEDTAYVPWLASEYVVINLTSWVTSRSFTAEVHQLLTAQGIEINIDDLQRAFAADSARSILSVYLGWDDKAELEAIGNATIQVLQEKNQVYFPQFELTPARVVALDDVHVVQTTPPLTTRLRPFMQIVLGGVVGFGLAFLATYFDDRIREEADVEGLGLVVIGRIGRE